MRQFIFRAWDGKEMRYKLLVARPQFCDALSILSDENFAKEHYKVEMWKVMQYTGLNDKNKKPIYEGDLIKIYDDEIRKVEFKNAFWMLQEYVLEDVLGGFGTDMESGFKPLYRYAEWAIEIIGNIHENPELLK